MTEHFNRRSFLKKSLITSTTTALGLSLEEKALLAQEVKKSTVPQQEGSSKGMPMGKIGNIRISRLFAGGNLISSFAHSRDLVYVSSLLRNYFTDDKVMETLEICEETGINTAILRLDNHCIGLLKKYRNERGGGIQWIAQIKIKEKDLTSEAKKAIDNGAVGAYVHGGVADSFVKKGQVELLGKAVDFIKQNKVIGGVAGHSV
ncbi:MAG: hypothetical protein GWN67_12850, partial [Phycisphaerae bacterium]|nr:hypothetical protein [Phycisphaerae bacterium]NIP54953.1 hypothetical protein [Phycisphaerae bacterium]NIS52028.1 hypothetical protein [Phycisphaerae bacterium]NIU07609.1 hypothetical protein [Phycisphaerae bacterium]NIU57230.1 hypothetical protein [Phycisphaerae bacterium]